MFRLCTRCLIRKSIEEFGTDSYEKDLKNLRCKSCERELSREYTSKDRKHHNRIAREWRRRNRDRVNLCERERRKEDLSYSLGVDLSVAVTNSVKSQGARKANKSVKLLGCSIQKFLNYISEKFEPGMTWENHGRHTWHLDHIRPCCSFDLTKLEEQYRCFHYTNYQPLWAFDNLSKGGKYET